MAGQTENIDLIRFVGGMDTDSPNENIGKGFVRAAYDVIWRGPVGNRRPETTMGTTLVPNALLPNTGTHLTIGAHYDAVYKRVFFFNWNSTGKHGIYVFNTIAQPVATFQTLMQVGTNTVGDPLGFTPDWISSIDILYADAPIGPILYYVDTLGRPTQININRYLAATYPAIQRSFIDVIKAPPIMPPQVTYENDFTVQANGLINSLWKFAYAFFSDNNEKTVISTAGKVVLPTMPFDPTQNVPVSQNARLGIYVQTGDATIKSIRLYGKETKNGSTTDWMILSDIKKSDFGIADNSIYKFLFFNTGSYLTEDPSFAVLDFDVVPFQTNSQVLLDGTTPAYAGIKEGYDWFNPVLNVTAANQTLPQWTVNGTLFFAAPNGQFTNGQPQIQLFLTGVGNNDGSGNPVSLNFPPNIMTVRAKSDATDISFSFSNGILGGIPDLLAQLQSQAIAAGWVFDTSDTNSITIHYPTGNVVFQSSYLQRLAAFSFPYQYPQLAFYPECAYQWGAMYFDSGGRTNGVISNLQGQITTPTYAGGGSRDTPEITHNVSGYIPPAWAVYWRPARTDQLTFGFRLDWISDSAYSGTGQLINTMYAYFGITNIFSYNQSINATQGVVSYGATSFAPGDRIRVLGRYAANGGFTALNLDYAILGVVVNPVIAGVPKIGTFIQINYPSADINANFSFDGTSDFQNYKILIYNYKAQNTSAQNTFWEIGETFGIGNPGTNTAYHMGNVADNIVKISDGDIFFRPRTVPIQNEYEINTGSFDQGSPGSTLFVNPGGNNVPIVDNGIWSIVGDVNKGGGLLGTQAPFFADTGWTIFNKGSLAFNVRFRGEIPVVDKNDPNGEFALWIKLIAPGNVVTTQPLVPLQTSLQQGVAHSFIFDGTITMPPNTKIWLVSTAVNEMLIGGFVLTLDVIRNIPIFVFDASFSDIYNLKTNSDNRPSDIDSTALQTFFPTLFRFAEPYVPGTNIFLANRFFDVNKDEFDASHGQVMRMIQWQRRLRIAQERKWGEVGVYSKFIKNNNGTTELIVNDQIIEQNNIQYFDGDFGVGNQTEIGVNGFQIWFFDPVRGTFCRLSLDGIKQISEEFLVQKFAGSLSPAYLLPYVYPYGGNSRVKIVYNFTKDRYAETIFSFQQGTLGSAAIPAQSIAFIEKTNLFSSYYKFAPDAIVCAENQLISFSQGQLYLHNDAGNNRSYYGTPIIPQLDLIFNDQEAIRKTFQALSYQPANNKLWKALNIGDINTSFINPQTGLQQISQLIGEDFSIDEGQANAAFLRDANSGLNAALALNEGDYLKGYWLRCLLTAPDSGFNFLYAPFIRWDASKKTP